MAYVRVAYREEPPFDREQMSQFWEAALNRFKAYVEAEESRNEQAEDSVNDSGKRHGD